MRYQVRVGGRDFDVELGTDGVSVDGERLEVDMAHVDGTEVRSLLVNGVSHRVVAGRRQSGVWDVHLRGRRFRAEVLDERTRRIREMTGAGAAAVGPRSVVAPMPGLVVKVEVGEGDAVTAGQGVVIVEAMKMENELRAHGDGVVTSVLVSEGDAVEKDQVLVELAGPPEASG